MEWKGVVRTEHPDPRPPAAPPAVWAAFAAQGAWKSWVIVVLLAMQGLLVIALVRLASRPPEYVLVDSAGQTTPIRRSVATDALLTFLADRTRPPEVAIVRFTRDFLNLALALNSSTVDTNWPAALAMMTPELRARVEADAAAQRLVERYRFAQRKTELTFEEITLETRTPTVLAVRATLLRRILPLVEGMTGGATDRVQVELVERVVAPSMERPDGLEVEEWRLIPLPVTESAGPSGEGKEASRDR